MSHGMSLGLRRTGQLFSLGLLVLLLSLAFARRGVSQTALAAYQQCMEEAAVEANNCYMSADGYWQNKACDWSWDINKLACVRALGRAIGI